jgi:hypothetical protein
MKECDSGIWFNQEDPDDEAYDPKCCTNVYLDYIIGKFDIIDYADNDEDYADNDEDYADEDYDADNEYDNEY